MQITLQEAIFLKDALAALDNAPLGIKTAFKIAMMSESLTSVVQAFQKERVKCIKAIAKTSEDVKALTEGIDYILLRIEMHAVPVLISDFEAFNEEIRPMLDEKVEITEKQFKVEEFQVDKKNMLVPSLLKVLKPYIVDIDSLDE